MNKKSWCSFQCGDAMKSIGKPSPARIDPTRINGRRRPQRVRALSEKRASIGSVKASHQTRDHQRQSDVERVDLQIEVEDRVGQADVQPVAPHVACHAQAVDDLLTPLGFDLQARRRVAGSWSLAWARSGPRATRSKKSFLRDGVGRAAPGGHGRRIMASGDGDRKQTGTPWFPIRARPRHRRGHLGFHPARPRCPRLQPAPGFVQNLFGSARAAACGAERAHTKSVSRSRTPPAALT